MQPKLEETIYVHAVTSDSDGNAAAADAAPTVRVFEDSTDAEILAITSTAVSGKTGQYKAAIACTAANGFEADKSYNVSAEATLGGISGRKIIERFQIRAAKVGDDTSGVTTLLSRLSSARAGYLDKLNVSGVVASQADVLALNQSASRRLVLTTVQQFERPESGPAATYEIELRTYDGDGSPEGLDPSGITLTATAIADAADLTGNLSLTAATDPGVFRWSYSVSSAHEITQIRFDVAVTLTGGPFTIAAYAQVCDFVASTWTTADRTNLNAIAGKLPSKSYLAGSNNSDGDIQLDEATGTPANSAGVGTLLTRIPGTVQPQTGDSYTRLGAPAGASVSADIAAVKSNTQALVSQLAGPGADPVTLEFYSDPPTNSTPIADADVWISSDSAGNTIVAGTLQTNSQGKVTFLLDAGSTYYAWLQKDGVNPIKGQSFVAEAD